MSYKLRDIVIGLIFAALIIGVGFMQAGLGLKNNTQVSMLLLGILTLASLFAKHPFRSSILFFILLGTMLYINIFVLTNLIINLIQPINSDSAWFIDTNGERHRVMQTKWMWGVLAGLVLSPLTIILYHKKIERNKILEISLTILFIILTTIFYIKNNTL